jgi:Phosphoesterase family
MGRWKTTVWSLTIVVFVGITAYSIAPGAGASPHSPQQIGLVGLAGLKASAVSRGYLNNSSSSTLAGIPVATGDAVYVSVCVGTSATVSSVSDSESRSLKLEQDTKNQSGGTVSSQYSYVASDVAQSAAFTVSVRLSYASKATVFAVDVSGVNAASPVDVVGPGNSSISVKNVPFSDSVVTTKASDLAILAVCSQASSALSAARASTLLDQGTANQHGYSVSGAVLALSVPTAGRTSVSAQSSTKATVEADAIAFASGSTAGSHPIQHVVFIVMENAQISQVWQYGPYERYLASAYGNESAYYAPCHPSSGNYLAMIAAVTNQCGTDSFIKTYTNTTLGDTLSARGFTWANYAESLSQVGGSSGACKNPNSNAGDFVQRHVPFLHFSNVTSNLSSCKTHILDSSVFNGSVANGTMLNFSFYSPNLCDDTHSDCTLGTNDTAQVRIAQGEKWLRGFLAPMLNGTGIFSSAASRNDINHTLFVLVRDEAGSYPTSVQNAGYQVRGVKATNNTQYCALPVHATYGGNVNDTVCGGNTYLTLISPYSKGLHLTVDCSAYSLAAMVEWLFNLTSLGNTGHYDSNYLTSNPGFPNLSGLFSFAKNGY